MKNNVIKLLNHGYIALDDKFGSDRTPAICARTSFNSKAPRSEEDDQKLTKYLVKHKHTTPLEFIQVRFYMKMPIFVARQLVRHRTASINELSLRYVKATEEFYVPALDRCQRQSVSNKQGSADEVVSYPHRCQDIIRAAGGEAFRAYNQLLVQGLSKELARTVLPLGTYTEWYWQNDMNNILKVLELRLDPHAQYEIRVYAQAMLELLQPHYPNILEAFFSKTP